MRQKHRDLLPGFFHNDPLTDENETKTLQIVRQFREEYKRIDEQLAKYPAAGTPAKQLCTLRMKQEKKITTGNTVPGPAPAAMFASLETAMSFVPVVSPPALKKFQNPYKKRGQHCDPTAISFQGTKNGFVMVSGNKKKFPITKILLSVSKILLLTTKKLLSEKKKSSSCWSLCHSTPLSVFQILQDRQVWLNF